MPCKIQIKENVQNFVDKNSQRGLSMSLQDANILASNINAKMKNHVVSFYNDGGKVGRIINIPDELVDTYFDIEVKRRTPITSNVSTVIKDGVSEIFSSNPELASIGTPAQYSQYLDTIFPDSKVKDIVYHGSDTKKEKFSNVGAGTHFGTLNAAKQRRNKVIIPTILNINNPVLFKDILDDKVLKEADKFLEENKEYLEYGYRNEESGLLVYLYSQGKIDSDTLWDALYSNRDTMMQILQNALGSNGYKYINEVEDKGSISYVVFEPEQIHILGSKQDIEGFKEFLNNKTFVSTNKFELDVRNLNLTPEVVNYLYQDSRAKSQGKNIETYKREISKLINNLQSDFTNSEILETIKCI